MSGRPARGHARGAPRRWRNVFTGARLAADAASAGLPLAAVFRDLPVAVLSATEHDARPQGAMPPQG